MELNKIHCLNCLEGLRAIDNCSVDLILTDPPYGINFIPQRENSRLKHHDQPIANDELRDGDWRAWFQPISNELYRVLKDKSVAYFFCGFSDSYFNTYQCLINSGFEIKAFMIWVKNNFGLGYHFRRQYEGIVVAFKGEVPVPKSAISDVIFGRKIPGEDLLHSCQKPEEVIRALMKQYSKEGDIVLDPFMGSGTTALVAQQINRQFIGFEIEEKYIEIANKRLKQKNLFFGDQINLTGSQ